MNRRSLLTLASGAALASCRRGAAGEDGVLRLGHFPNVTHVQALVAHQLSRQGRGWFEPRLDMEVRWLV